MDVSLAIQLTGQTLGVMWGGVLSPLFALLAIVGLLFTIRQQQTQIESLSIDQKKDDLFKKIEWIEKDINEKIDSSILRFETSNPDFTVTTRGVLFDTTVQDYATAIVNKRDFETATSSKSELKIDDFHAHSLQVFTDVGLNIGYLMQTAKEIDVLSKNSSVSHYYKGKFLTPIKRLKEKGLLLGDW